MTLRDDLNEALKGWNVLPVDSASDDEPLLSSGRLDSSALFELSLWIEERIGHPLDPSSFDIAHDWDTVAGILAFIERARSGQPAMVPSLAPVGGAARARPRRAAASEFEIIHYSNQYKGDVLELQKRLWSSSEDLNRRFFEWRYEQNPVEGEPLVYLAISNGRPVAMRGAFASRWQAGRDSEPRTWYQSDDLVVLPDYENRGAFAAFSDHMRRDLAARGHRFFLSMSALRVTRMQSVTGGARSIGSMEPVGRLSGPAVVLDCVRRFMGRVPYAWRLVGTITATEAAAQVFVRIDQGMPSTRGAYTLTKGEIARPADMAALIAGSNHDGRFRQVRDASYFAWRYRNPLHAYRFIYADSPDGLAGYLILERSLSDRANQRRVTIADWEARSDDVLTELLRAAIHWGRPAELVSWTQTLGMARVDCLRHHGFSAVDSEQTARGLPSILVWDVDDTGDDSSFDAGGRSLLNLANWDLRMADTSLA